MPSTGASLQMLFIYCLPTCPHFRCLHHQRPHLPNLRCISSLLRYLPDEAPKEPVDLQNQKAAPLAVLPQVALSTIASTRQTVNIVSELDQHYTPLPIEVLWELLIHLKRDSKLPDKHCHSSAVAPAAADAATLSVPTDTPLLGSINPNRGGLIHHQPSQVNSLV